MTILSACSETQPAPQVFYHANLTARCSDAPPFEGATSDDLVDAHLYLNAAYSDCATRHNALVGAIAVTP